MAKVQWFSGPTGSHVDGSWPLLRALHVELNLLSFLEGVKIELLKAGVVEENLPAVVGIDKPQSTVANDFLN